MKYQSEIEVEDVENVSYSGNVGEDSGALISIDELQNHGIGATDIRIIAYIN